MRFVKIFLTVTLYFLGSSFLHASLENKIIVKVGNNIITEFDIKNKILSSLILANQEINQFNIDKLKQQTLESLIILELKKAELSRFDFKNNSSEIELYIDQISQIDKNEIKLKFNERGIDYNIFYEEVETQLKWQKFIYNFYKNKINIDDSEVNNEIKKLSTKRKNIQEFRISELEILLNNNKKNEDLIKNVLNQIDLLGFENSVAKFSISSTSTNKGDLGWINSSSLSKQILEAVSELQVGQVSQPIIRQNSVLFLKLTDKRSTLLENKDLKVLKKNLINQKKNELFNLYSSSHLSKLKNSIFIEYK